MVNEHVYIFRANNKILQRFLFYLFNSHFVQFQVRDLAYRKKGQPGLNSDHLSFIKLPFFSIDDQKLILSKILAIENEIVELKRKKIPINDIINMEFASSFDIDLNHLQRISTSKYLLPKLNNLLKRNCNIRSSFRWNMMQKLQNILNQRIDCIDKLGRYVISTKNGWSPISIESGKGIPVLGQEHISYTGSLNLGASKFTLDTRNSIEDFFIKKDDLFVSRGNTVDLVALASVVEDDIEDNILFPDLYIKLEIYEKYLNKKYLALLFNSFIGRIYFKYASKGKNQTMVKISSTELNDFHIPIPDISVQEGIVHEVEVSLEKQKEIDNTIEKKRKEISDLLETAI